MHLGSFEAGPFFKEKHIWQVDSIEKPENVYLSDQLPKEKCLWSIQIVIGPNEAICHWQSILRF